MPIKGHSHKQEIMPRERVETTSSVWCPRNTFRLKGLEKFLESPFFTKVDTPYEGIFIINIGSLSVVGTDHPGQLGDTVSPVVGLTAGFATDSTVAVLIELASLFHPELPGATVNRSLCAAHTCLF